MDLRPKLLRWMRESGVADTSDARIMQDDYIIKKLDQEVKRLRGVIDALKPFLEEDLSNYITDAYRAAIDNALACPHAATGGKDADSI